MNKSLVVRTYKRKQLVESDSCFVPFFVSCTTARFKPSLEFRSSKQVSSSLAMLSDINPRLSRGALAQKPAENFTQKSYLVLSFLTSALLFFFKVFLIFLWSRYWFFSTSFHIFIRVKFSIESSFSVHVLSVISLGFHLRSIPLISLYFFTLKK